MRKKCSTTLKEEVRDRARGALLGLAVGDAVGTTLEFKARDSYAPLTDMVGGGPFGLAPGVWTDDTSMALALAESLAERGALDPADLMERFVRWWRDGEYSSTGTCFDIGMTTRASLARFEQSGDPIAGTRSPDAAGNGSLMRLAPVAIYGLSAGATAMRQAARIQSATTHAARACLDACEAWSVIVNAAIGGTSPEDAIKSASTLDFAEPIAAIAGGSWQGKPRDAIRSSGYVLHSFEAALWCVGQGGDFREVVLRAANLGDDADTTAAITGQLIGALVGETGIPDEWLDRLAWRERITRVADRLISLMDGRCESIDKNKRVSIFELEGLHHRLPSGVQILLDIMPLTQKCVLPSIKGECPRTPLKKFVGHSDLINSGRFRPTMANVQNLAIILI